MYHYFEDKEFLKRMRMLSGEIMQSLCHNLKEEYGIGANFYLVGSGVKNLIMQNESQPVDLDYNLEIIRCDDFNDLRNIKESVRKSFNKALHEQNLYDCEDSKSSLSSKLISFINGKAINPIWFSAYANPTNFFKVDVCITARLEKDKYYRLIHKKTGYVCYDEYYWNISPNSKEIKEKANFIKKHMKWDLLRNEYEKIKNRYLMQNDHNHPSFICYVEAVNNVYNRIYNRQQIIH